MFQDFTPPNNKNANNYLAKLRKYAKQQKWDYIIIPHNDEQRNEYLPKYSERLAAITAFTGSAGTAIIGQTKAILFTDGRYTLQAKQQTKHFEIINSQTISPHNWLGKHGKKNCTLALDPWLHTNNEIENWQNILHILSGKLHFMKKNAVDIVWHEKEKIKKSTKSKLYIHPEKFCGQSAEKKLQTIKKIMQQNKIDLYIINDATCIAWAFNIRGNDIAHVPIALCRAIISVNKNFLFVEPKKIDTTTKKQLAKLAIIKKPNEFENELANLSQNKKIMLDKNKDPQAILDIITKANGHIIFMPDPIVDLRSIKNTTEINGAKNCHIRDGAALTTFLHWLAQQKPNTIDEIMAAKKLEHIRKKMAPPHLPLRDIAFDSISASGKNGAIIHYRVNENSNAILKNKQLYLIDSGGQYDDGTTDATRTISIGKAGSQEKEMFTRVLKGHIALQCLTFPIGTRGQQIDVLARSPLWQKGCDYQHGTGHGVGSYLSVHEAPISISPFATAILQPRQILSNEPAYYCQNKFGIRIENLMLVKKSQQKNMLQFENLTWAPLDKNLIDVDLLNNHELKWLNNYHAQVFKKLEKLLDKKTRQWLALATAPLYHS